MKRIAAYYLLVLYSLFLFRPLIPVLSDYIGHSWNEAVHLLTVHQQQGADHLHEALAQAAPTDEKGAPLSAAKWLSVEVIPTKIIASLSTPLGNRSAEPYVFLCPKLLTACYQPQAPPPRF